VHIDNAMLRKFKKYIDIQEISRKERSPKMTTNNIEEDVSFIDVFALQNSFIIQRYIRV
jgi:hypothetical protein